MSELTPPGSNARMTAAQVKKYVRDMKSAQEIAEKKLKEALNSWEGEKEQKEIQDLEKLLDEL